MEMAYTELNAKLCAFLDKTPNSFFAVNNIKEELAAAGFTELQENSRWQLQEGGKYYVSRNGSALLAFVLPKKAYLGFQVYACHCDSPAFKLKNNAEIVVDKKYVKLNVEKYGGMLLNTWLDRPLSVAGRVLCNVDGRLEARLVNVEQDLMMIPNLAIHMNREANTGLNYNAQKDMIPLIGETESKGLFDSIIADAAQTDKESVISSDLFLYNRQAGTIWGADNEFISAPRLDDVMCAYSCMNALIDSDESNQESVAVCAVFDNEEVGSSTKQGADSTFLSDVLMRIAACAGKDNEDYIRACAGSFMLSADNAHAVHPNYQEKADPTNRPHMNKGIVIKYNANQKYTTDAVSAAIFKEICTRAGVPTQEFANRSDIPGGSTLGNIANCHVSMNTVDIGLAQLAMHSPYETAGIMDTEYMIKAVKEFFETAIVTNSNGTFTLE